MTNNKYVIFISYRREGGYDTAKHLYDLLTRDGYRVSFDIDTLRNGNFDTSLLKRIYECKDFILILDKHAFDRTLDTSFNPNNDWLRQELAYALKQNKNIIPVFLNGMSGFPPGLPSDISGVIKKNGPEYNRYYFNDFYKTLKERFIISKPNKTKLWKLVFLAVLLLCIIIGIIISQYSSSNHSNLIDTLVYTSEYEQSNQSAIAENSSEHNTTGENNVKTQLMKFTGDFYYTIPNAGYGGINTVYELVLDPINSSASIVEDGIVNIENSKGYCGTMMKWPEYWEVLDFSINKNGKDAIVEMHGGDNNICEVKLELDDYNNIIMSFISGNEGPGVLLDYSGNYTKSVVFKRDK